MANLKTKVHAVILSDNQQLSIKGGTNDNAELIGIEDSDIL